EILGHYLGSIPERVDAFFKDLNKTLFDLGIYVEAQHNEAAPNQFEIATTFENCNISIDYNQLLMHILQRTALKHDMVCLLKEKPFKGINGSGKHNNYSLVTNYGLNFFSQGKTKGHKQIFMLSIGAMIETCNKYQNLIRIASSSVTNDYRLGGDEAPPAIISMFIGQDLEDTLKAIAEGDFKENLVSNMVKIPHLGEMKTDTSDRNRTSPIAFTGNKFEFRMLGSSQSAADLNTVINLAMAEVLEEIYARIRNVSEENLKEEVNSLIKEIYLANKNILFQGDGYSKDWKDEAKKRGLENYPTYLDALRAAKENKAYQVFEKYQIFSGKEIESIINVGFEDVSKYFSSQVEILNNLIHQEILPSAMREIKVIKDYLAFIENDKLRERSLRINEGVGELLAYSDKISNIIEKSEKIGEIDNKASFLQEETRNLANKVRKISDDLEKLISRENY